MLLGNRERAIETFEFLRDLASDKNDPALLCEAYKLLGISFHAGKENNKALICFKKILELATSHSLVGWDTLALQGLAVTYFSLNAIKKSTFYRDRAARSIVHDAT